LCRSGRAFAVEKPAARNPRRRSFEQCGNFNERLCDSGVGGVRNWRHAIVADILRRRHWRPMMA
jgi:hypothetical protein